MARHRNIRNLRNYDDFDDDYAFGHSLEEDCISPTDAQQWLYDRERGQNSMASFLANNQDIEEEDEEPFRKNERRDSDTYQLPELPDEEKAKLLSCLDEIRGIVGDTSITEKLLVETIIKYEYDCAKALDFLLNNPSSIKCTEESTLEKNNRKDTNNLIEKGISEKLLELTSKHQIDNENIPQIVIPVGKKAGHVTRGFDVGTTPKTLSPIGSGRASPMHVEEQPAKFLKVRENNRNVKEMYSKERGSEKQHLHLVVIGHVDAGKSTLMGHLLFDVGNVPQRLMHKYEQESKKLGKQSFMYAWVLDETGEERARGITMDIGSSNFETPTKHVTLLDAPGHKDFIPNMISGANQADVALLVVDSTRGEFETGFELGGQTREHALLVKSLGVTQLGVVVNKLDTVSWSQDRFLEIVAKLKIFLKQVGFKEGDTTYIPCSGLTGENLVKPPSSPELLSWYNGPTLFSLIDNFRIPERPIEKPFRLSINDIFKSAGSGFCVSGRVESGVLCVNDKVLLCPCKEQATVKSIMMDDIPQNTVFAGDQVSITLFGVDITNVSVGNILCDIYRPIPLAIRIRARIIVFSSVTTPITKGYPVVVHHQSLIEPATIVKLKAQLHKSTGEVAKKNPRCLGNNCCALVEIEFTRPICMERFADCKELGRIMLRVGGITIAAGLCTDIVK
ncbi:protein HBS1 isoform X2 [Culicoides brevitarsis]